MANRLIQGTWKHRNTQRAWRAASWTLLALLALVALAGCANVMPAPGGAPSQANNAIAGTARILERTVLPANSVFEATLEEVAGTGMPNNVVGTVSRPVPGVSVVNFSIPFADSQIRPGRRYVVRARVLVSGQLLFVTDQAAPALANAQDRTVAVTLVRPAALASQPTPRTPARTQGDTADRAPPAPAGRAAENKVDPQASRREAQARAQALAAQAQSQAGTRAPTQAQARADAQAQAKAQADGKAVADAQAQAQAQAQAEARAQTRARAEAQVKADAQAQAKSKTEARALAQAQAQARERAKAQADAEARTSAQAQAEARAQARARAEAQVKADAQAQATARADATASAEAQAQADARAQTRARAEAQARAETQSQAQAQSKAQAQARALADAQAAATPVPAPVPVPATTPAPSPAPAPPTDPAPVLAAIPAAAAPGSPAPTAAPRAASPESPSRTPEQRSILRGLYRFAGNAGTFDDCASGARLPVAQEGANVVIEGAYLRLFAAGGSDTAVLATVSGRVLPRPGADGRSQRNTLVIDGFISLGGDACPSAALAAPGISR